MPFRSLSPPRARRFKRWTLPGFALMSVLLCAAWVLWALTIIPGGFQHATAGAVLLLVGCCAIFMVNALTASVVVTIVESALVDHRALLLNDLAEILQHMPRSDGLPEGATNGPQPGNDPAD